MYILQCVVTEDDVLCLTSIFKCVESPLRLNQLPQIIPNYVMGSIAYKFSAQGKEKEVIIIIIIIIVYFVYIVLVFVLRRLFEKGEL